LVPIVIFGVLLALLVVALVARTWPRGPAARRLQRHVQVEGLSRRYVVWLPDRHREKEPLPVVLAFHGGFATPEQLEESAALHEADEAQNFVIVYPEGYERSWNAVLCCGAAARDNIDDLKFVGMLLDDLESVFTIDSRRVYATGFSNGALFAYHLAATMADRIAAIAPVSGAMQDSNPNPPPSRAVPVFHWHGLEDRFAPFGGGMSAIKTAPFQPPVESGIEFWRHFDGADTIKEETLFGGNALCLVYSGGRDGTRVQLCRVPGLGHQWPGSRPTGQYAEVASMFGPLGPPMDANDAILKFFSEYALPSRRVEWQASHRNTAQRQAERDEPRRRHLK
jgi:polyhydroxybutyrate depolymerase